MSYVRATLRLLVFSAWTTVIYATALCLALARPVLRSSLRWRARVFRIWCVVTSKIINMSIDVRGTPPRPPFLLVSNHLGYVDVVLLGSRLDCIFVARGDVARWPIFGALCRAVDTMFIDRGRKRDIPRVIRQIKSTMDQGAGVLLFPEGTSSNGAAVMGFKPGLLEAAARARIPVSYATVSYRTEPPDGPAHERVCWWGGANFPGHLFHLFRLRRIHGSLAFGDESILESDRKVLATRLQRAVAGQFRPVVQ